MNKRNKLKKQWKKICATTLAVCLIGSILLSNGVGGAFAEEDATKQEEQTEETSTQEENKIEEVTTAEEKTTEASTQKKEEVTTEEKKAEETQATTENKTRSMIKTQQAAWKYTNENITVSGDGTNPLKISKVAGSNESQYVGSKTVVFDYSISSTTAIDGEVTIDISDCGIMSDDKSLEIWHIQDSKITQVANEDIKVTEGKVSFKASELGEYIAVSNVTTVDLSKGTVTVYADRISGTRQDGKIISQEFSTDVEKKYRISQTDKDSRGSNTIWFAENEKFEKNRTVIIDNINTGGTIRIPAKDATKLVTLQLRGTNQVKQIYYGTGKHDQQTEEVVNNDDSKLKIENYGKSDGTSGELYIPYKMSSRDEEINYVLTKGEQLGDNWAAAGIGGSGGLNNSTGLTIAGGTIKVLGKNVNGATAIGGGGNGDGQVSITGGNVTAICSSTGAAIGGGIGWIYRGGNADVSITGGSVYAENMNYYSRGSINFGGVAIGSGSSTDMYGSKAKINISGNSNVKAYAHYGNGIGSGNSYKSSAAKADITIGGNSVVKTNALGGGTSKENQGGSADIVVKDSANVTCEKYSEITDKWDENNENMLNAYGIGGGNSADTYDGGSANVSVTGGTLNCNGGNIGGGDSTGSGNGGNASITVTGGTLNCASIGGGNSDSGKPGSVSTSDGSKAGVVVTGDNSNVKAGTIGGGKNNKGDIGFATVDISGGKIQGQFILSNTDSDKQCTFKMTGGVIDNTDLGKGNYKKAQENGGAVYLSDPNGKVSISGGTIQNCNAELGGAVYLTAGEISLSGTGKIQDCTATKNGGAIYLGKGKVSISGGSIGDNDHGNQAIKGAGIYQANGEMLIEGGTILGNHASEDGGGTYLTGGELKITGGSFNLNEAKEGGAVYVSDSKIRMFGGSFTSNKAKNDGGAMYISSDNSPADVIIRSGTINKNTAGEKDVQGNGGGIAVVSSTGNSKDQVIIGLCETHPNLNTTSHTFDSFKYTDTADKETHTHESCPVLKENESYGNGGGIYMSSSNAELNMYCLEESGNTSKQDSAGNGVMSTGGTVNIGDKDHCDKDARGNIIINSSMLVSGGAVSVYGNMNNPFFRSNILVNIKNNAGEFHDYRKSVQAEEQRYKVHYFENFEGSGMYSALQYDNKATIQAEGAMYIHEGWKIVGWQDKNSSKIYNIGDIIGSATNHEAWGTDGDSVLELNALWERTKYTIVYDPNAEQFSGSMDSHTFTYNNTEKLSENQYKVVGKRFTGWNTKADGTGQSYDENYNESKISSKDGDLVTLYAQWVKCTHKTGDHQGTVTYQKNDKGDTITEVCDCGGHTVSVTLSGITVYHDGNSHPAILAYTGGNLFDGTPTVTYQYKKASNGTYGNLINGETIPQSTGYYKASITVGNQTATVEYEIKSPSAGITQEAKVIKGQYFKAFNGQSGVKISQDDSFTVHYTIKNLKTDLYTEVPTLKFDQMLPKNTKIIMLRQNKYWYYTAEKKTDSIKLTDFVKMGATENYQYTDEQKTNDQEYSFIVDFSKTAASDQIVGTLTTTLNYPYTGNKDNVALSASVALESKEAFAIQQSGTKMTVKAPIGGTDSRWKNKKLFLRLTKSSTSGEELPSDAKLTVVKGEQTIVYTMNQRGEFLISLNWEESQNIQLSIHSDDAQAKGKVYNFTAKLEVASKDPDNTDTIIQASELETKATKSDISLTVPEEKKPSLKLEAVGTEKRIFTTGEKLNLNVTNQNIEQATMRAEIQKKTDTDYSGVYLDTNISTGENNFTLGGIKESGSYRLIVIVTQNSQTILTVPYYFVVEK